jgi:nitrate reductase alpha subunit
LAFGTDWSKPPRLMNGTSFFYFNSSQYRYEKLGVDEILSPLADKSKYTGSLADFNLRAVRMGWLPSIPQLNTNPLKLMKDAEKAGIAPVDYAVSKLKDGSLDFAYADPDSPENFPRVLYIWRSNLLGSSGKGHEYMLKHLLGTRHGLQGKDLGERGATKPEEIKWRDESPEGKLDLLVTLDFRMCTTALYSDIVLPTATWYEKDDLNTSDMHPFIHPLSKAVDPAWEARSDWEIFKGIARTVSDMSPGVLGVEKDLVLVPTLHDTPNEIAMPYGVTDWKKGECELIPGKTAPSMIVVERDYPNLFKKFSSLGPLLDQHGNGGKGMNWDTKHEVEFLAKLNRQVTDAGVSQGRPCLDTAIDAAEAILHLAPETNGHVAVKAWESLERFTGREHQHLAVGKEHEAIRFRDIQAQPRKIISSPIWSGLEDENVSYNAGYTNVHELIPWRTLTGRQQFYQDHEWMRDFGEGLMGYRPPVDTKTIKPIMGKKPNGNKEIVLNWITPHQKWGIHSTYSDNLLMQTLSRGGPIVWLSEDDAKSAGIEDNDWIELFNVNGAIAARAVVSQRVMNGIAMMYHAQERIINTPGSEISGTRGGIHNSVTRVVVKPTHMIGGYAQLSYGFNYYGTVGTNRDELVVVRKMDKVEWHDGEPVPAAKKKKEVV